jgi:hypothetical protein
LRRNRAVVFEVDVDLARRRSDGGRRALSLGGSGGPGCKLERIE